MLYVQVYENEKSQKHSLSELKTKSSFFSGCIKLLSLITSLDCLVNSKKIYPDLIHRKVHALLSRLIITKFKTNVF